MDNERDVRGAAELLVDLRKAEERTKVQESLLRSALIERDRLRAQLEGAHAMLGLLFDKALERSQ